MSYKTPQEIWDELGPGARAILLALPIQRPEEMPPHTHREFDSVFGMLMGWSEIAGYRAGKFGQQVIEHGRASESHRACMELTRVALNLADYLSGDPTLSGVQRSAAALRESAEQARAALAAALRGGAS